MSSRLTATLAATCAAIAFGTFAPSVGAAAPATAALAAPPSPALIPTGPNDDPAIDIRAQEWFQRVATKDIDLGQLSDQLKSAWSPDALSKLESQLAALGKPTAIVFQRRAPGRDGIEYTYRVVTPNGQFTYRIGIGWDSLITSFSVEPVTS